MFTTEKENSVDALMQQAAFYTHNLGGFRYIHPDSHPHLGSTEWAEYISYDVPEDVHF